jgi:hypothetical protein
LAVQQQIQDAEYFLEIIRIKHTRDEMRPNLKAFLSTARGIPDYILEDYNNNNNNFGLGIPLTVDSGQRQNTLNPVTFKKEAKSKNNQEALKFIDFFDNEFKNLKNESVVKLLFEKRNIMIHRTSPSVRGEIQATITEKISISESASVIVRDKDGNIKQQSNTKENKEEHTKPSEGTISTKWFFEDYPQREVPDVCHSLSEKMKDFVKKIHEKFPVEHSVE